MIISCSRNFETRLWQTCMRHVKRKFFGNLHPHNQQEFWKVVKSLNSKQSVNPMLRNGDIIPAASNLEKANLLNASLVKNNHSLPGVVVQVVPPSKCPLGHPRLSPRTVCPRAGCPGGHSALGQTVPSSCRIPPPPPP